MTVDHLFVSRHELQQLSDDLHAVRGLVEELAITVARLDRIGRGDRNGNRTKPSEYPAPMNLGAYQAGEDLHTALVFCVNQVCEQRGITDRPGDTTPKLAAWIDAHLMSVGTTQGAGETVHQIRDAIRNVRFQICPPVKPIDPAALTSARRTRLSANGIATLARRLADAGDERYADLNRRRVKYLREIGRITPVPGPWKPDWVLYEVGDVLDSHERLRDAANLPDTA
ncbi:hypothetical protein ACTHQY_08990 [Rhodococcoides corynebacterioides]|uniref:hypothetical protein n=1 Tax=Rhodococcoides corynebacterioides TaxID=53972 RepID=UPI003F7E1CF7